MSVVDDTWCRPGPWRLATFSVKRWRSGAPCCPPGESDGASIAGRRLAKDADSGARRAAGCIFALKPVIAKRPAYIEANVS